MVISQQQRLADWHGAGAQEVPYIQELQQLQRLIEQVTADGQLARWDQEVIVTALTDGSGYSSAKCGLFRQLQERVWRAELYLEPR